MKNKKVMIIVFLVALMAGGFVFYWVTQNKATEKKGLAQIQKALKKAGKPWTDMAYIKMLLDNTKINFSDIVNAYNEEEAKARLAYAKHINFDPKKVFEDAKSHGLI